MSETGKLALAAIVLGLVCLSSGVAGAAPPLRGVQCSWTCHCARHLKDCDGEEAQWEACVDTKPTRQGAESCDQCKQLAQNACHKQTCPPDPQHGPKSVFELLCNGEPQPLSAIPARLADALAASPSIALPSAKRQVQAHAETRAQAVAPEHREVKCTFGCGCAVSTGLCDEREKRSWLCIDKADSTKTAHDCVICYARAWVACNDKKCPLAEGTSKVVVNFACPAT